MGLHIGATWKYGWTVVRGGYEFATEGGDCSQITLDNLVSVMLMSFFLSTLQNNITLHM